MKASFKGTAMLAATLFLSLLTCYGQDGGSELLEGTWTKSMGQASATLTMTADLEYEVWFSGGEEADVWGSYEVKGNTITFTDEGGAYSSGSSGVYEFKSGDNSLSFTIVDDPVEGRSMLVKGTWSKAGDPE